MGNPALLRLQKYIADCGITSRRKAELLITQGRVKLNGKIITQLGAKLNPAEDVIAVDGKIIYRESIHKLYILFHKPRSVVTTLHDPEGRKTVIDFFPMIKQRIYPIGRLDYYSEGLLLLTNDGEIAHKVMHPSSQITKIYEVKVFGAVTAKILQDLKKQHSFPEGPVRPKSVRIIQQLPHKTWLEFRLNEGRNREIRRICETVGLTIDKLKRVAMEALTIQGIAPGEFRFLTKKELESYLGFSQKKSQRFISQKRTIDVRTKGHQQTRLADDPYYFQYRKENYQKTLSQHSH